MAIMFFTSDLNIGIHLERYKRTLPLLSRLEDLFIVYFTLPLIVQASADDPELQKRIKSILLNSDDYSMFTNTEHKEELGGKGSSIEFIDISHFINTRELKTEIRNLLDCGYKDLIEYRFKNLTIAEIAGKDVSLCLKRNIWELLEEASEDEVLFIKLTAISIIFSMHIAIKIANHLASSGVEIKKCIIPDHYSAYIGVAKGLEAKCITSTILTADPLYQEMLRILPVEPHSTNIAIHNVQHARYEYNTPESMFSFARDYINRKIIRGESFLAYSTASSDESEQAKIIKYAERHRRTITYYTSSPDEQFGNSMQYDNYHLQAGLLTHGSALYKDEYDLLLDLLAFCQESNRALIIRLHPRLGHEKRNGRISSSLIRFYEVIERFCSSSEYKPLVIAPDANVSSYWLGSKSEVNIFFRSSIGLELSLLGFPAISPNHLDSFTYQGMAYESAIAPKTSDEWFLQVNEIAKRRFSYYLHLCVRSFFIQRICGLFCMDTKPALSKIIDTSKMSNQFLSPDNVAVLASFIGASSSLSMPTINGYWRPDHYLKPLHEYLRWLSQDVYPALGVSAKDRRDILLAQYTEFSSLLR